LQPAARKIREGRYDSSQMRLPKSACWAAYSLSPGSGVVNAQAPGKIIKEQLEEKGGPGSGAALAHIKQ